MNEEIKEILKEISDDENYSNFIASQNGGAEYYLLLEKIEGKQLANYITNLQKEKEDYKQRNEKAIDELFELKNMIYKPETREENFEIQRKISSIIKKLGLGGDEE